MKAYINYIETKLFAIFILRIVLLLRLGHLLYSNAIKKIVFRLVIQENQETEALRVPVGSLASMDPLVVLDPVVYRGTEELQVLVVLRAQQWVKY